MEVQADRRTQLAQSLQPELSAVFMSIEAVFRARLAQDPERLYAAVDQLHRQRRRYLDYLLEREENGD